MLGKHSTTELYLQSLELVLFTTLVILQHLNVNHCFIAYCSFTWTYQVIYIEDCFCM
jgi:hypothetical protein